MFIKSIDIGGVVGVDISLVVIGRNDEAKLRAIYEDDEYFNCTTNNFFELIYVDSCSSDGSLEYMISKGFKGLTLAPDSFKCASAGRRIGAENSNGKYIIFLDSDMKLNGFNELTEEVASLNSFYVGLVGKVTDIYPNGTRRERVRKTSNGEAKSFGGFVIFNKEFLIRSGNWNNLIPANEELELHTRIKKFNGRVKMSSVLEVEHYTDVSNPLKELLSLYIPTRINRYGAFGYVMRAAFSSNSFKELIKLSPEFFVFIFLVIFSSVLSFTEYFELIIPALIVYLYYVYQRRSLKYVVVPPGIMISCIYGLFKYKSMK
ncbi:Glycosyltransferase 2-like domain-containing protein [Vibrio crassostreae]|uniref:Glycosyltransferase 2-like domain-containing protein n=1 Tax=Vibrio crassostreae TaxID=246167 RepID=A0A822MZ99_9VIBR|nr:glycosyltransferase [Vibrio crassostreae]MDH5952948.1 glycosyltransferase [Vibrio crassostreae]ROR17241.1 glycosyltransferase involved in cell wall biosynthesis [Vibrio crassostreae]TCN07168.1 glycosyltransferase involved in cell wall biosynthesis [Vibrio crassostreae]TCU07546.1 glycosyltransferase involved in cell wall biosynthesis [Vibrio crassostreae]CAK2209662.1 Glycosyltransferase 2-like domain-containing protein [Vibrio crassostreae]